MKISEWIKNFSYDRQLKETNKMIVSFSGINFLLLVLLIFVLIVNQVMISQTKVLLGETSLLKSLGRLLSFDLSGLDLSGELSGDAVKLVVSKGVPEIYGSALGVSFDTVQASINVMRQFDPTYGTSKIVLAGEKKQRYIDVASRIACEYCCGAKSLITPDGDAACGCAHSIALRGLLAYLLEKHADQYSNDELLRELARWKGVSFPKQMIKKIAEQLQSGQYTADVAALVLNLKLPDYGQGSAAPLPSEIENLPGMVGGC